MSHPCSLSKSQIMWSCLFLTRLTSQLHVEKWFNFGSLCCLNFRTQLEISFLDLQMPYQLCRCEPCGGLLAPLPASADCPQAIKRWNGLKRSCLFMRPLEVRNIYQTWAIHELCIYHCKNKSRTLSCDDNMGNSYLVYKNVFGIICLRPYTVPPDNWFRE